MNILYISKLDGRPWVGPTYSVPKQISAQAGYDNILWFNLYDGGQPEGIENINKWRDLSYYTDLSNVPNGHISDLPAPFNSPDLIVVEQCYPYARNTIRHEIMKSGIPYIVIPRGEFTKNAQNKKALKKKIGNFVLQIPKFVRNGIAIQCLTNQENKETDTYWGEKRIILPNGTDIPDFYEKNNKKEKVFVSIGRYEPYQKGLDLLIDAVEANYDLLISNNINIALYGSNMEHKREILEDTVKSKKLESIITFHDGVFGEEKDRVLRNADAFLMPSRFEGHPTGLLEALAYGLPCLATTGSNMREEIVDSEAGWGADNTSESVSIALRNMINNINTFEIKGKNARALANQYSWDAIAKRSSEEYTKLLQK